MGIAPCCGSVKWGTGYSNLSTLPRTLPDTAVARQWAYPQQRTETGLYIANDQMGPADGLGQVLVKEKIFEGPVKAYPWWKSAEVVKLTAPQDAKVLASAYRAEGDRALVLVVNLDREEREVSVELVKGSLFPENANIAWRDIDPGLTPPAEAAAGSEEIKKTSIGAGVAIDITGDKAQENAESVDDELAGTSVQGRALKRLGLKIEGNTLRTAVRARDYRVFEARLK